MSAAIEAGVERGGRLGNRPAIPWMRRSPGDAPAVHAEECLADAALIPRRGMDARFPSNKPLRR